MTTATFIGNRRTHTACTSTPQNTLTAVAEVRSGRAGTTPYQLEVSARQHYREAEPIIGLFVPKEIAGDVKLTVAEARWLIASLTFQAGIRATELRPGTDRGTSLITGVSDARFEPLKWHLHRGQRRRRLGRGHRGRTAAGPARRPRHGPGPENRGGTDSRPAAAAARALAPDWSAYRSLTGVSLYEQLLAKHGIKVPTTGNKYPLDPALVRRALAARPKPADGE